MSLGFKIYKITNKKNGKCYIGASENFFARWGIHSKRFDPNKYKFEILAEYNNKEEMLEAEKYWIWRFNSYENGYNNNKGGVGRSKEYSKEIRDSLDSTKINFNDLVKINNTVFYITIPSKKAKKIGLKKGDIVNIIITKLKKEVKTNELDK